ncbi:malate dehydrogenase [Quercus suber]|uniref:Malate dehydrogenase n=1 Tax=Quercus suber TaxID=58331 RepID=A0AAW0JBN5_QUESU
MKLNPLVSKLSLYDITSTPGVAANVSHINTKFEVTLSLSLSLSLISMVLVFTDLGFFQTSFSPKLDLTLHLCS